MAITRPLFTESSTAQLWIYVDQPKSDRLKLKGLNTLTPPGLTRQTFDVTEFGAVQLTIASLVQFGMLNFGGNAIFGDEGAAEMTSRLVNQQRFTDMYVKLVSDVTNYQNEIIMYPDFANDPDVNFQVSEFSVGQGTTNGVYPLTGGVTVEGLVFFATAHLIGTDFTFVAGTPDTITTVAEDFVALGFKAGMTLLADDDLAVAANFGKQALITNVATNTLTLNTNSYFTNGAASATEYLRAGRFGI